jgi:hypothetical protein
VSAYDEPAFPVNTSNAGHEGACYPSYGMTLRDYFAAKAMQACIPLAQESEFDWHDFDAIARAAYTQADAMLKARKAK